jgi:hypothetical protein
MMAVRLREVCMAGMALVVMVGMVGMEVLVLVVMGGGGEATNNRVEING